MEFTGATVSKVFIPLARVALRAFFPAVVIGVVGVLVYLYDKLWKKPEELRRKLRAQGITGPPARFLYGNLLEMQKIQSHPPKRCPPKHAPGIVAFDYVSNLFPYLEKWKKEYGAVYTYSAGIQQHVYVGNVEMVKEMNLSGNLDLVKPLHLTKNLEPIFGHGIFGVTGRLWSHHRNIIAPQFFMDKVKGMTWVMLDSAQLLLKKWDERIDESEDRTAEIKVDDDFKCFSADVISRACFGSSYVKGKHIFSKLRELENIISHDSYLFQHSFIRFFQRKKEIKKLEKEIESLIWETVEEREGERSKTSKDLLERIMEGAVNDPTLGVGVGAGKDSIKKFIVGNCKSIYFAGHETTSITASWCLMLLALHPDWQSRIRTELSQLCPNGYPDVASILLLKTVGMVIQEVLRLYPPTPFVVKEARADTRIGNITVPKGVCLWTPIQTLNRDSSIWGDDANEFKPERFANGIATATKFPQSYIPFGIGPRTCLGKNFALVELKIIISLIVSKFQFSLSPTYQHSLSFRMLVAPADGVRILIKKL